MRRLERVPPLGYLSSTSPSGQEENPSSSSSKAKLERLIVGTDRVSTSSSKRPRTASPTSQHEPVLPEKWEKRVDGLGNAYYMRTQSRHTQDEPPQPLIPGWAEAVNKQTGELYYYHTTTRETVIERPENNRQPLSHSESRHAGEAGPFGVFGARSTTPDYSVPPEPPIETWTEPSARRPMNLPIAKIRAQRTVQDITNRLNSMFETKRLHALLPPPEEATGTMVSLPRDFSTVARRYPHPRPMSARDLQQAIAARVNDKILAGIGKTPDLTSTQSLKQSISDDETFAELADMVENFTEPGSIQIAVVFIMSQPLNTRENLCKALVRDLIDDISHLPPPGLGDENSNLAGRSIRSVLELLVNIDSEIGDPEDRRFSDILARLEYYRMAQGIDLPDQDLASTAATTPSPTPSPTEV